MIRKISIGVDYKNAMHYQVGQDFGRVTIDVIKQKSPNHYQVYVKNADKEVYLWKEIVGMPVIVEMDVNSFG